MKALLRTDDSLALLLARLALGGVMLPHGLEKTLGLFGGGSFAATMEFFTAKAGMPASLAVLVIVAESAGALGLIVGLLTRVAGFGIGSVMVGAILTVHLQNGFFMNWFGQQQGEGIEYHLLALGLALALFVGGGGKASIDRGIAES